MAGAATMARPKKPKAKKVEPTYVNVTVRASEQWKAWVDGLANHCRTDLSKLIDRALVDMARKEGYEREVPDR